MEKRLSILVLSVCIVVAGSLMYLFEVVIPSNKYNEAEELLNKGETLGAIEIYEKLADYKDSAEKAVSIRYQLAIDQLENQEFEKAYENFSFILDYQDSAQKRKESGYAYAKKLFDDHKYDEAASVYESLKDYQDSLELKKICYSNLAQQLYDAKNYYSVITMYEQKGPFSDDNQLYKAACYNYGLEKSDEGNRETAIRYFTKAEDYSDAKEKIMIEKYDYIQANFDKNNPITFEYLKELKDEEYKDCVTIYNNFYAWQVTVLAVNSDIGNRVTNKESISMNRPIIFHYKLTGGEPGGSTIVYIKMHLPNDEIIIGQSTWAMKNGSVGWHGWEDTLYDAENGETGTLIMEFYDSSQNLIGSGTVEVTS